MYMKNFTICNIKSRNSAWFQLYASSHSGIQNPRMKRSAFTSMRIVKSR